MRAIIIVRNTHTDWLEQFFPTITPACLPVLGKSLVGYWLDFFVLMGIREVRVVTEGTQGELPKQLSRQAAQFSDELQLSFGLIREEDSPKTVFLKNKNFWANHETYYLYGYGFLFYQQAQRAEFKELFVRSARRQCLPHFFWGVITDGRLEFPSFPKRLGVRGQVAQLRHDTKLAAVGLDSCKAYYELSMQVARHYLANFLLERKTALPVSAEPLPPAPKFLIGEKVLLKQHALLEEDFFIGNRVVIEQECVIGRGAILLDDVFVDEGTRVANAIIMPQTYVGKWLNISDAIVYRETMIHVPSGHVINFVDDQITGNVHWPVAWSRLKRLWEVPLVLLLWCLQTPVYLLFRVLTVTYYTLHRKQVSCYLNKRYEQFTRWEYQLERGGLAKLIFMQSFLDKRELLVEVIRGRLTLVGHYPLEVTLNNKQQLRTMQTYCPGAFWYSEMVDPFSDDENELMMNELYFSNLRISFKELRMFVKIFFRRFFKWV